MDPLWPSLAAELKKELPAQQFDTWIKPLRGERHGEELLLLAPNHHVLRWVRSNLLNKIESRIERVAGTRLCVNLVLDERPSETEMVVPEPVPVAPPPERTGRDEHRLNPGFTFGNFVNGKANQIARAAAIQVAENPGTAYNPLFIYGGTGLGKTHLLQAIGTEVLKRNPKAQGPLHPRRAVRGRRGARLPAQELRRAQALLPLARPLADRRRAVLRRQVAHPGGVLLYASMRSSRRTSRWPSPATASPRR